MLYSKDIQNARAERQRINLQWRSVRNRNGDCQLVEKEYRIAQQRVREAVERERVRRDNVLFHRILSAPKNVRAKRVWCYVNNNQKSRKKYVELIKENGDKISQKEYCQYLREVAEKLLD